MTAKRIITCLDTTFDKSGKAMNIPVIASGGVGTMDHIYDAFVCGAAACLCGRV